MKKFLFPLALMLTIIACSPKISSTTAKSESTVTSKALHERLIEKVESFEKTPSDYLFVLDGYLVAPQEVVKLKELKPSDLIVVEVLKHHTAKAIYGNEAKENTLLINTRNMNSKQMP